MRKRKEILGENYPDTLMALNNLAVFYNETGEKTRALELLKEVYEKRKEILGEKNPKTLSSLNNLAIFYDKIGEKDKGLRIIPKSI